MDFPEGDTDKFYIGAEDFNVYQCNLHSESKQYVEAVLQGHNAPVTSIHAHPGLSQSEKHSDLSDLVLSSSLDWTIKLWHPKEQRTLLTFESS